MTKEIDWPKGIKPEVGMPASTNTWTDWEPGTIVKVSASGKTIWIQEDHAEMINAEELKFHIGGFAANCSNQEVQKYEYKRNLNGCIRKATLRTRRNGKTLWKMKGSSTNGVGSNCAVGTRFKHYDYNF